MKRRKFRTSKVMNALVKGFFVTIFIFLVGFVAMLLFWMQARTSYTGDKGFFYWKAATWGDGLCLPVLVGALYAYKSLLGEIDLKHRNISYVVGSVLGIVGIVIQVSWVISDKLDPNWTIELHHFYPSGWYHAIYFVFMFFLIAFLLCQVFFARKKEIKTCDFKRVKYVHMFLLTLIWFSGLSYLLMHNIDDIYTPENYIYMTRITLIFFIISAFLFCLLSLGKGKRKWGYIKSDIQCIFSGIFGALGFGLSVYFEKIDYINAALCIGLVIVFVKPALDNLVLTLLNIFLVILPTFFLTAATLGASNRVEMICLAIITIFVPCLILTIGKNKDNKYKLIGVIVLSCFMISNISAIICADLGGVSEFTNSILGLVVTVICSLYIPRIFNDSVVAEEKNNQKNLCRKEKIVYVIYIMMLIVALSAIGMVLHAIYVILKGYITSEIKLDFTYYISNKNVVELMVMVILLCILLLLCLFKRTQIPTIQWIAVFLIIVMYGCVILFIHDLSISYFDLPVYIKLLNSWIIFFASLFISTGFYNDIIRMQGRDKNIKKITFVCSTVIFVGCIISSFLIVYSLKSDNEIVTSVPRLLIGIGSIFFCVMILPILCCVIICFPKRKRSILVPNIMHLGFLSMISLIIGVLLVSFVVSLTIPFLRSMHNIILNINLIICAISLIFALSECIIFCLDNNINFLNEYIKKNKYDRDEEEIIYNLIHHLRMQNCITILLFLPFILLRIVGYIIYIYIKSNDGLLFIIKQLISKYILLETN